MEVCVGGDGFLKCIKKIEVLNLKNKKLLRLRFLIRSVG
jgi:hypothetical protein